MTVRFDSRSFDSTFRFWFDILHIFPIAPSVSYYALINVKPQGVGGAGRPRGIWNFHKSQSQIPHPWAPRKCRIPTPGYHFLPKTGLSYVKFPNPWAEPKCQYPHPGKSSQSQFPLSSLSPPPHPGAKQWHRHHIVKSESRTHKRLHCTQSCVILSCLVKTLPFYNPLRISK